MKKKKLYEPPKRRVFLIVFFVQIFTYGDKIENEIDTGKMEKKIKKTVKQGFIITEKTGNRD